MKKNKTKQVLLIIINVLLLLFILYLVFGTAKDIFSKDGDAKTTVTVNGKDVSAGQTGKLFENFTDVVETTTISTEMIEEGLEDMGFLTTEKYFFTQYEKYSNTKKWGFVLSSTSSFAYTYDGCVYAGIDCTKVLVNKDEENKTITITLPEAEIQSIDIDFDSFQVVDEKTGLFNKQTVTNYNDAMVEFKEKAKEKALEKGVLEDAQTQAKSLIENFVNSLVDTDEYTITYVQE